MHSLTEVEFLAFKEVSGINFLMVSLLFITFSGNLYLIDYLVAR